MPEDAAASTKPLIFVTVGTDPHPFDRLIDWVDSWMRDGGGRARCLVQSGKSRAPRYAEWRDYLAAGEMEAAMREAAVVVSHGGPGTVTECHRQGLKPIVVPRIGRLGEHVDDHQLAFTRYMAARGEIFAAHGEAELHELLNRALERWEEFVFTGTVVEGTSAIERFERLVDELLRGGSRRDAR